MGQSTLIWNLIAKRYSKTPIVNEEAYQKKLDLTRKYLNSETSLFEFGCGTGSTAIAHAPYVKNILAIDIAHKMLDIGRSRSLEKGIENIDFRQEAIEGFTYPERSFDMVLAMNILHIVGERENVLLKVNRLLKNEGIFVSSTVCMDKIGLNWKIFLRTMAFLKFLPPISFFSEEELVNGIKESGFEIEYKWRPSEKEAVLIIARKIS